MARTRPGILGRETGKRAANVRSDTMKRRLALLFGVAALVAAVVLRARRTPPGVARSKGQEPAKPLPPRPAPEAALSVEETLELAGPGDAAGDGSRDPVTQLQAPTHATQAPSAQPDRQSPETTRDVVEPAEDAPSTPTAQRQPARSAPATVSPPLPTRAVADVNAKRTADAAYLGALSELPATARRKRRVRLLPRRGRAREGLATWLPTVIVGGALLTGAITLVVSETLDGAIELVSNWFSLF